MGISSSLMKHRGSSETGASQRNSRSPSRAGSTGSAKPVEKRPAWKF
jgi:hypothetical protein